MIVAAAKRGFDELFNRPYLLLTLAPMCWAGNFVIGRAVAGEIPPITLGLLRWSLAVLIMLPFAWRHIRRDWPVIRRHLPELVLLGIVGPFIFNSMTYVGLNFTTALNGVVLQSSGPIFIAMATFVLFGDRLSWRQMIGVGISLAGVLMVIVRGQLDVLLSFTLNRGDLWIVAAFIFWGIYTACLRLRPDIHWLSFAVSIAVVGAMANIPLVFVQSSLVAEPVDWSWHFSWSSVLAVIYVALFASVLSYNFYNRGVQLIGGNRAGVFLHLVPLFGSVFAISFLGERLEVFHLTGFAMIITGVWLAARQ